MPAQPDLAARTPSEIWATLFDESARLTDVQLLVLILGMGTTRSAKGRIRRTWTAIELAHELLSTAGGRLEHLVASARQADFDLGHFGLGKVLGCRLLAAMELAHRWRRGFERSGDLSVRWDGDVELIQRAYNRDRALTEGELMAVLLSRYKSGQKEAVKLLASYGRAEILVRTLTPAGYEQARRAGTWAYEWFDAEESAGRLLAAVELARRHRAGQGSNGAR